MNEQEPIAEQENPEYEAFLISNGRVAIAHAKGIRLMTPQSCVDELNDLVRQRDAVIKERDTVSACTARLDVIIEDMEERARSLIKDRNEARAEAEKLRCFFAKYDIGIQQELGKSLGYPWYKDDQKNFQCATESNGVCVGDHTGETLAIEAAEKIRELRAEVEKRKVKQLEGRAFSKTRTI